METTRTNCQYHQGFPRAQSWVPSYSCSTLMTYLTVCSLKSVSLQTVEGQADSKKLQEDLNVLQDWEKEWDMEFNPSKCQVVHITRSKRPIQTFYSMHGQVLEHGQLFLTFHTSPYLDSHLSPCRGHIITLRPLYYIFILKFNGQTLLNRDNHTFYQSWKICPHIIRISF